MKCNDQEKDMACSLSRCAHVSDGNAIIHPCLPGVDIFHVFAGIDVYLYDVQGKTIPMPALASGQYLRVTHCLQGRLEYAHGDEFIYLEHGDMCVDDACQDPCSVLLPSGSFRGMSLVVDVSNAPRCLSCIMDDVTVAPTALYDKFCGTQPIYVARASRGFGHVFSEMYQVEPSIRDGYLKVKVLEMLLLLSAVDPTRIPEKSYSRAQAQLALRVSKFLADNLDQSVTIEELSSYFGVSPTQLKNCFQSVYGCAVHAYVRNQKILAAAHELAVGDRTVLDIASQVGYANGSKFAKAFREVLGCSPREYRTSHTVQMDPKCVLLEL